MIAIYPKPPKDNEKRRKQVRFNEKGNCACDNGKDNDEHKIYAFMSRMSSDDERKSVKYGDSSQSTNWILDSGAMCHMTPEVLDFIPGTFEYIEVADGRHVTEKQKVQVQIQVPSHQKIMKNGESKYILMKKVIVHATTAKITTTIRYTHLWHKYLVMTNAKV